MNVNDTSKQQPVEAVTQQQATEEVTRITSPPKLTEQDIEQTLDTVTKAATSQATPDSELSF